MKNMKKITILTGAFLVSSATVFAANGPAKTGLVFQGQVSANYTPSQTFNAAADNTQEATSTNTYNGGIGGGLFLGYNYAITPNVTIGAKTGYQYIYNLNQFKASYSSQGFNNANDQINVNNIPVLATANYYFNSGWLIGAEGGIDIQQWTLKQTGDDSYLYNNMTGLRSSSSQWNVAPMAGLSLGYQWNFGLALTANADYVFGKSTSDITSLNNNDPLAFYTVGVNLSYTLPV